MTTKKTGLRDGAKMLECVLRALSIDQRVRVDIKAKRIYVDSVILERLRGGSWNVYYERLCLQEDSPHTVNREFLVKTVDHVLPAIQHAVLTYVRCRMTPAIQALSRGTKKEKTDASTSAAVHDGPAKVWEVY